MRIRNWLLGLLCGAGFSGAFAAELNVSAAASLTDCMNELIAVYRKAAPQVQVVPNYAASGTLVKQIENGAPADVFLSADQARMDLLEKEGMLLPGSRCDLVENRVVLIVPSDSALKVKSFEALASAAFGKSSIAIGDPEVVPAGRYAVEVFRSLDICDAVMPKTVFAQSVRAVLAFVARGEVEAGVVYRTDAMIMPGEVRIVAEAPADSHTPVIYPAAVIASGSAVGEGKAFLAFLKTPEAAAVFEKYGFKPVEPKAPEAVKAADAPEAPAE